MERTPAEAEYRRHRSRSRPPAHRPLSRGRLGKNREGAALELVEGVPVQARQMREAAQGAGSSRGSLDNGRNGPPPSDDAAQLNHNGHSMPKQIEKENAAPRSWANVARTAMRGYDLKYVAPITREKEERAVFYAEALAGVDPMWAECVVGYLIGKKLPFRLVETALKNAWGPSLMEVKADDRGFFFFRVPDAEFRRRLLDNGPVTIARVPLILQQWHPLLELKKNNHSKVPVWIRLRNIPFTLWSSRGISGIASVIGNPLYVDQNTEQLRMLSYARVCVELAAADTRKDHVIVEFSGVTRRVEVEYEWRPISCKKCGTFGHRCNTTGDTSMQAESRPLQHPNGTPTAGITASTSADQILQSANITSGVISPPPLSVPAVIAMQTTAMQLNQSNPAAVTAAQNTSLHNFQPATAGIEPLPQMVTTPTISSPSSSSVAANSAAVLHSKQAETAQHYNSTPAATTAALTLDLHNTQPHTIGIDTLPQMVEAPETSGPSSNPATATPAAGLHSNQAETGPLKLAIQMAEPAKDNPNTRGQIPPSLNYPQGDTTAATVDEDSDTLRTSQHSGQVEIQPSSYRRAAKKERNQNARPERNPHSIPQDQRAPKKAIRFDEAVKKLADPFINPSQTSFSSADDLDDDDDNSSTSLGEEKQEGDVSLAASTHALAVVLPSMDAADSTLQPLEPRVAGKGKAQTQTKPPLPKPLASKRRVVKRK